MAPYLKGETDSFVYAFFECDLGMRNIRAEDLDDTARSCFQTIKQAMDTTAIDDLQGRRRCFVKAEKLSVEERSRFSLTVDELADWLYVQSVGL